MQCSLSLYKCNSVAPHLDSLISCWLCTNRWKLLTNHAHVTDVQMLKSLGNNLIWQKNVASHCGNMRRSVDQTSPAVLPNALVLFYSRLLGIQTSFVHVFLPLLEEGVFLAKGFPGKPFRGITSWRSVDSLVFCRFSKFYYNSCSIIKWQSDTFIHHILTTY